MTKIQRKVILVQVQDMSSQGFELIIRSGLYFLLKMHTTKGVEACFSIDSKLRSKQTNSIAFFTPPKIFCTLLRIIIITIITCPLTAQLILKIW